MPPRLKKLIGTVILLVIVVVYALVAVAIASTRLAESSGWVHLAFFAFSGVLWVLPAMGVIWWMEKKPRPRA